MDLSRRGFISALSAFAAAAVLDPELLIWKPGAKTIFIPAPKVIIDPYNFEVSCGGFVERFMVLPGSYGRLPPVVEWVQVRV